MTSSVNAASRSCPPVAAVCVYPDMVPTARETLGASGVHIASVATAFPSGRAAMDIKLADTRDAVEATLPVNLITITPVQSVAEQDAQYGKDLYKTNPDLCCALRKVQPLATSLDGYDAWATGLRRAETHNRIIAPVIGWDAKKGKVKVSPIARWSDEDVERYITENGVLVNPLVQDGYPSIGCWPCTRRVAPGEDPRSGRWAGSNKTECGIHS